jgi:hypothetical protein
VTSEKTLESVTGNVCTWVMMMPFICSFRNKNDVTGTDTPAVVQRPDA